MDLDNISRDLYQKLYKDGGEYILDGFEDMTYQDIEDKLKVVYLYCNPWHGTDQAQHYDYLTFYESIDFWAKDDFYKQHKAAKFFKDTRDWLKT